jgi:hypothetical protein
MKMKKPAEFICQRAVLLVLPDFLSIRPLTLHRVARMMMVMVCRGANHEIIKYRAEAQTVNAEF